jgi:hypothetical protein
MGTEIVVSAGAEAVASGMLSMPITLRSCGTRTPSARTPATTPSATRSLWAITAEAPQAITLAAAAVPPSTVSSWEPSTCTPIPAFPASSSTSATRCALDHDRAEPCT